MLKEKNQIFKIFLNAVVFLFMGLLINQAVISFVLKMYFDIYERALIEDSLEECVMYITIIVIYWTLRSKQRGLYFTLPVLDEENPLQQLRAVPFY